MTARVIRQYGATAWLMACDPDDVPGLVIAADQATIRGVVDVVPGAASLLVRFDPTIGDAATVANWMRALIPAAVSAGMAQMIQLDVVYDGSDLGQVAALCDLSIDDVIDRHASADYVVAFCGFTPRLRLPDGTRSHACLASPRHATAGSPGGISRDRCAVFGGVPALVTWWLAPGRFVRRSAVRSRSHAARVAHTGNAREVSPTRPMSQLVVVNAGVRSLIQDTGRPGYARLGIAESGAYDRAALAEANRLVGNGELAGIECLLGGLQLRCVGNAVLGVTGAPVEVTVQTRRCEPGKAISLSDGDIVRIGRAKSGLRSYVAVRGGLAGKIQLGSQSTDTMSGLGPRQLSVDDHLDIGDIGEFAAGDSSSTQPTTQPGPRRDDAQPIRVVSGPHDDLLARPLAELLADSVWTVSPLSDRIGLRLTGPGLPLTVEATLPSEPTIRGAIQVLPDGQLVILGPDRPTTGGYPVVGVVIDADLDRLAQLRPGSRIRLAAG